MFVRAFLLPLCLFEELTKGRSFTFSDIYTEKFVAQWAVIILLSNFEKLSSAKLVNVVYENSIRLWGAYKKIETVCFQSIGARKKDGRDSYFDAIGNGYIVSQNRPADTSTNNAR